MRVTISASRMVLKALIGSLSPGFAHLTSFSHWQIHGRPLGA